MCWENWTLTLDVTNKMFAVSGHVSKLKTPTLAGRLHLKHQGQQHVPLKARLWWFLTSQLPPSSRLLRLPPLVLAWLSLSPS